ncbi:hypothetical protein [Knoellia sp. p5-6-4]|uniref:hypothetical protein n=1 Tax=unclassified Knoellia TaxID=2618719 RepID=UPI0023DA1574|nr:hypothetical protein [Knoellia sp. p5-6-4]MDF2146518.1 hypothetical protein [Knoellia sp. p5-6-4]
MSDVNSERARHEARESVGNRPPREGENRVEAAMRRYLGAEMFDELHRPEEKAEKKPPKKAAKPAPAAAPEEPEEGTGEKA